MTRKDILDAALKCVNGDRDQQYGNPEDSFRCISEFWNSYIFCKTGCIVDLKPKDAAAMLALLKLARIAGGQIKDDNWIDLAGYAACGGEVEGKLLEKTAETYVNIKTRELLDNVYTASSQNLHNQKVTL